MDCVETINNDKINREAGMKKKNRTDAFKLQKRCQRQTPKNDSRYEVSKEITPKETKKTLRFI